MVQENKGGKLVSPPSLWKAIGPSVILLGLGLGSGELILWPYLVSNFGLGIIWAAVVGITFQFFINMEIERYSLLMGESVFVGFSKYSRKLPYWFIFSTFIAWMWPGIIATSAKIFSYIFNVERFDYLAILLLILIGAILTLGPKLYKTVETFQKFIIIIGIPLIAIITFIVAKHTDFAALGKGIFGIGDGYLFIPRGIPLFTFLGALAYSGAGGNLNLAQSFYIKEKGYGMCRGVKGITSILTGKSQNVQIYGQGADFSQKENLVKFKSWWQLVNLEHLIVFLITGAVTILLLALLAFATVRGSLTGQGIDFLINEAKSMTNIFSPILGGVFLMIMAVMLFATQLTVLDSTSRIISENIVIIKSKFNLSRVYYFILWAQIIAGIVIFLAGYRDPITLIVTGAVINAFAMLFYIAALYFLNKKFLPKEYQLGTIRKVFLLIAWIFFGVLGIYAIINAIK